MKLLLVLTALASASGQFLTFYPTCNMCISGEYDPALDEEPIISIPALNFFLNCEQAQYGGLSGLLEPDMCEGVREIGATGICGCDFVDIAPSMTPSTSDAPSVVASLTPTMVESAAPSAYICTRRCINEGEACLENENRFVPELGLYQCTCLPGYTNTANGDACRVMTDEEVIQMGLCDICAETALTIIQNGQCDCVCPAGTSGGARTGCFDPNTVAPSISPSDAPSSSPTVDDDDDDDDDNSTRRRMINMMGLEDRLIMEGPNACDKVDKTMGDTLETRKACAAFESLELIEPKCDADANVVPKIFHTVAATNSPSFQHGAIVQSNPEFVDNRHDDESALKYVQQYCGSKVAAAYSCLAAPAYRADIFRFCALYAEGGVYLDDDLIPVVPLTEMYSPCSTASIGYDFPRPVPAKQMKIMAGAPGAPIFKCMLDSIVDNVKTRAYPETDLLITGPALLHKCYEAHQDGVAITYKDTKMAAWPYSGLRAGDEMFAVEVGGAKAFAESDPTDYSHLFKSKQVYKEECELKET